MEAAGCYGRNGADDVTADAALLSRAVGRPVRVQLTRDQEHQWEPKGAGAADVRRRRARRKRRRRGLRFRDALSVERRADAGAAADRQDFAPTPAVQEMGDRTAIGPYDFANHRVVVHDMAPIVRAAWLRGVSALPNTFAHEILHRRARGGGGRRSRRLSAALSERSARASTLSSRSPRGPGGRRMPAAEAPRRARQSASGRGFAYARLRAFEVSGPRRGLVGVGRRTSRSIPATGEVSLTRVTVGQDSGLMINPDGVRHQIHGNVIQSTSRVLKEQVTFSDIAVDHRATGAPIRC